MKLKLYVVGAMNYEYDDEIYHCKDENSCFPQLVFMNEDKAREKAKELTYNFAKSEPMYLRYVDYYNESNFDDEESLVTFINHKYSKRFNVDNIFVRHARWDDYMLNKNVTLAQFIEMCDEENVFPPVYTVMEAKVGDMDLVQVMF